jgi:hypothetical protein
VYVLGNDEIQQTLKEWDDAKSRYEEDIQRKSENMWFGSNFTARAFVRKTKAKKIDYNRNHLEESDGSSLLSDSELDELEKGSIDIVREGEGDGEGETDKESIQKPPVENPYANNMIRTNSMVSQGVRLAGSRQRAQTAGRSKRMPYMPRLIDTSRDEGDKLWFPNIDPVGAQELADLNDPKAKPKVEEPPNAPTDLGSIRPKTTEQGRRKIELVRRFQGNLIGGKDSHMDDIDNVFIANAGQDVVSLSIYNNSNQIRNSAYTQSAVTLPNAKLRPQSAPFKFASDAFAFKRSIRRDTQEELAEIESLKTKLTREDVPFKVQTIKRAFELPGETEFKGRKYPKPEEYLMVNPFPKKKKKKKGKKKKKKK